MLKINIKSTLTYCLMLVAAAVSSQVEIEHISTGLSPTLQLTEMAENNFTRLFFGNDFSDEQWRISSRAFIGGAEINKMDFNHYDGSSTTTFLTLNAFPHVSGHENIEAKLDVKINQTLTIGQEIPIAISSKLDIYSDDQFYGTNILNEYENASGIGTFGLQSIANGGGTGNRTGILAQGDAFTGDAWGVYAIGDAASTSHNEYGVYGEADGVSGQSWAIYGNGDIYYTGSFTAPSDARLKKNIQALGTAVLEKIMSLDVKTYEYDLEVYPSMHFAKGPQIGFLAQDLQALFPEVVTEQRHTIFEEPGNITSESDHIEILGVDYIKMIPLLTSAIQEQQEIIENMKSENESLKAEMAEIKNILLELK